jgi:hypothetical protein
MQPYLHAQTDAVQAEVRGVARLLPTTGESSSDRRYS